MIKYLGSKKTLLPKICSAVSHLPDVQSIADVFSGTSRVGHVLKKKGYQVFSNDLNQYASALARCYVEADYKDCFEPATKLVQELNQLKGEAGYFTDTFCVQSRFFQPKNGARVDAIRNKIKSLQLAPELESVILVSLMEAADRVDSTVGLQMAYLKQWAPRAHNDLELRVPEILPRSKYGKGRAYNLDALDFVSQISVDLAYLDPPYNQHKYMANYHIWETLIRWDEPDFYGVACKRMDVRERKSPYNSKRKALAAMRELIAAVQSRYLLVSFSDEGYINRSEMEAILSEKGEVIVLENQYPRHIGARIGIHNQDGHKVGSVSHVKNIEYLYIVVPPADFLRVYNSIAEG